MTTIVGTAQLCADPGATSITVPAGVTADMNALFYMGSGNGTDLTLTLSKAGVTFTQLDSRVVNNMWVWVFTATGLVAADTVTLAEVVGGTVQLGHDYTDEYSYDILSAGTRGGVSQTFTTTGSVTPASGAKVAVLALERTTATPTTVSTVVSSGSETVTQTRYDEDATTDTSVSVYRGIFTASAAAARTVTITYSGGSGNGYAALITTVATGPPGISERWAPDAILAQTGLTGVVTAIQDDPDSPDGSWLVG